MCRTCNVLRFAVHFIGGYFCRYEIKDMQKNVSLMVRLNQESKDLLAAAADLRRISVSDYVRSVMVGQATRELAAANVQTIAFSPEEQLEFWTAISRPVKLTKAQKELGAIMRGEV